MATGISLQDVLQNSPEEDYLQEASLVTIKNGIIGQTPAVVLTSIPTKVSDLVDDTPASTKADQIAKSLYLLGQACIVIGPKITASEPPVRGPSTEVKVQHLISIGIPQDYILWRPFGEESAGANAVLQASSLSVAISALEPSLSYVGGVITAEDLAATLGLTSPLISQATNGELPSDSMLVELNLVSPELTDQSALRLWPDNMTVDLSIESPDIVFVGALLSSEDLSIGVSLSSPTLAQSSNGQLVSASINIATATTIPTISQSSNGSFLASSMIISSNFTNPSISAVATGGYQISTFETGADGWVFSSDYPVTEAVPAGRTNAVTSPNGSYCYHLPGGVGGDALYSDGIMSKTLTLKAGGDISVWVRGGVMSDSVVTVALVFGGEVTEIVSQETVPQNQWVQFIGTVPAGVDKAYTIQIVDHYTIADACYVNDIKLPIP